VRQRRGGYRRIISLAFTSPRVAIESNPKSGRILCSSEMRIHLAVIGVAAAVLCATACRSISGVKNEAAPIVGT
jgi:hypothetical protein